MKMGKKFGRRIRDIILIIFAGLFLLPLYWMLMLSVKGSGQAAGEPWAIPEELHFENFSAAWQRINIPLLLKNSFIYTTGALIICLAVSVMVAYAITRMRMKHAGIVRMYFTTGMLIPVSVLLIPVYRLVMGLGMKGTYWALIQMKILRSILCSMVMNNLLFVCHGSILKNPEKVCRINDFTAGKGAYYTTTTPFLKEP